MAPLAPPLVHLDPNTPFKTDGATGRSHLYSSDTSISTGATTAYHPFFRLPSLPQLQPTLMIFFEGRPAGRQFTATLDMRVYSSGGSVQITAIDNLYATIVSHAATGGAPVRVPIFFTTRADGYGALLIVRIDGGWDWFGVDLQ